MGGHLIWPGNVPAFDPGSGGYGGQSGAQVRTAWEDFWTVNNYLMGDQSYEASWLLVDAMGTETDKIQLLVDLVGLTRSAATRSVERGDFARFDDDVDEFIREDFAQLYREFAASGALGVAVTTPLPVVQISSLSFREYDFEQQNFPIRLRDPFTFNSITMPYPGSRARSFSQVTLPYHRWREAVSIPNTSARDVAAAMNEIEGNAFMQNERSSVIGLFGALEFPQSNARFVPEYAIWAQDALLQRVIMPIGIEEFMIDSRAVAAQEQARADQRAEAERQAEEARLASLQRSFADRTFDILDIALGQDIATARAALAARASEYVISDGPIPDRALGSSPCEAARSRMTQGQLTSPGEQDAEAAARAILFGEEITPRGAGRDQALQQFLADHAGAPPDCLREWYGRIAVAFSAQRTFADGANDTLLVFQHETEGLDGRVVAIMRVLADADDALLDRFHLAAQENFGPEEFEMNPRQRHLVWFAAADVLSSALLTPERYRDCPSFLRPHETPLANLVGVAHCGSYASVLIDGRGRAISLVIDAGAFPSIHQEIVSALEAPVVEPSEIDF